jgi:iron complex outermembrane recepter protein
MKLKISMTIVAIAICFSLSAQFSINGVVKNAETNEPLAGAHVLVNSQLKTEVTNKNGAYSITGLRSGTYQIHVSYMGFESIDQEVVVSGNQTLNFTLKTGKIISDEVVVSATRADNKTPTTYEDMNKQAIRDAHDARNITSVLDQAVSVVTTSDAGTGVGNVGYRLRGTDETRINVTIDGVPLNDPESQGAWFVNLPDFASSVDNLQIQRGVGTSSNGAAAFGASMNFQTLKFQPDPYAEINEVAGSFNTFKHNVNFGTGLMNGKFSVDGRLSKITSDGFIDRATSDLNSTYLAGTYYGKKTMVKFMMMTGKEKTYQAWDGIPSEILDTNRTYNGIGAYYDANGNLKNYNNETDNYSQTHYHLTFAHEFNAKFNLSATAFCTRGFGYYEQYKDDDSYGNYAVENQIIGSDTLTSTDLIRRKYLDNYFYGITLATTYKPIDKLSVTLGGAANNYEGKHYGKVIWMQVAGMLPNEFDYYHGTGNKRDINVYGKVNYQLLSKLNLWVDIQYRNINYNIGGFDDNLRDISQTHNWNFVNPKGGVSYEINKSNQLYFSYAVAHREPTRSNLTDAVDSLRPTPETLNDFELGYHLTMKKLLVNANLYYMDYKDQLVFTGEINDVGAAVMTNVAKSHRAGIEISAVWQPLNWLKWNANATFSQNKINNFTEYVDDWDTWGQRDTLLGNTNIAFSPEVIAASSIIVTPVKNFELSILSKYVGKQYIDNSSSEDRKLDAYLVNNFILRFTFKPKFVKEVSLFFSINNLLNEQYEANAWIYSYYEGGERKAMDGYFPQAGRNFMGGVSIKL